MIPISDLATKLGSIPGEARLGLFFHVELDMFACQLIRVRLDSVSGSASDWRYA